MSGGGSTTPLIAYGLIGASLYYIFSTMCEESNNKDPPPVIPPMGPANGFIPSARTNYDGTKTTLKGSSKVPLQSQAAERSLFANGRQYFN